MASKVTLKAIFDIENLRLAWDRLLLNKDPIYKNYFRDHFKTYSLSLEKNLFHLSANLQAGRWVPTQAAFVYFPKKNGLLRKYSLLTVEDQIVYQAVANIIANKLGKKLTPYYNRKTFGYQLDMRPQGGFYLDYKKSYENFNRAIVRTFHWGNNYVTSFDLTSFYDSIDHHMLKQSLESMKVPPEVCDYLGDLLKKWTESEIKSSVFSQAHGIPQGPLSSPFFAELILHRFDRLFEKESNIKYLRYVDDIRLMAKNATSVKKELIRLDFVSKTLGLFPQSAKTKVYKISKIADEIKTITDILVYDPEDPKVQVEVYKKIVKITPKKIVSDESKLKYLLGQAKPTGKLNTRIIELLIANPHLYQIFINYLSRTKFLSVSQSKKLLEFVSREDVYYSVIAQVVELLRLHSPLHFRSDLVKFCIRRQNGRGKSYCELIESLTTARLSNNQINWTDLNRIINRTGDWWSISKIIHSIDKNHFGGPSVDSLLFDFMKSSNAEISLAACDKFISEGFGLNNRPTVDISRNAQILLRQSNKIKRVRTRHCYLKKCFDEQIMQTASNHNWKSFLGTHYSQALRSIQRWTAYIRLDPTAWINHTDVLVEYILDQLFKNDLSIGNYTLGQIGSVLNPTSRFATAYPKTYFAAKYIHDLRYQSDLSHPLVKTTRKYTRFISHDEARRARILLKNSFIELKAKGHL